jgi:hypothetical protein
MTAKKPFWDVDENKPFNKVRGWDGLVYKVLAQGYNGQPLSQEEQKKAADVLANTRFVMTKLLLYLLFNCDLWINKDLAWGIFHSMDLYLPQWKTLVRQNYKGGVWSNVTDQDVIQQQKRTHYTIMEMTPNRHGIIGLNKPKKIVTFNYEGRPYEKAAVRSYHFTIRNTRTQQILSQGNITDLVLHELAHAVNNDIRWKKDNHAEPYENYHRQVRSWARNIGIL